MRSGSFSPSCLPSSSLEAAGRKFRRHPEYAVNLVGFVDRNGHGAFPTPGNIPVVGPPERLRELVETLQIDRVVIAFPAEPHETLIDRVRSLADLHVHIDI